MTINSGNSKTMKWANGDLILDRNKGRPMWILGTEKAAQDVAYFLMTADDPSRDVGCSIKTFDIKYKNTIYGNSIQLAVATEVNKAIERLISWQSLEYSTMPDSERIIGIQQLTITKANFVDVTFVASIKTISENIFSTAYKIRLAHQYVTPVKRVPGSLVDDFR